MDLTMIFVAPVMLLLMLEEGIEYVFQRYVFGPPRLEVRIMEVGKKLHTKLTGLLKVKTNSKRKDSSNDY